MHVAIVIPAYKQPVFLREALQSVVAQEFSGTITTIVINDGCPQKETHDVASSYARWYPDQVTYIRKRNGGLSAARNTGIEYCLKMRPRPDAVYFLDSDNRLEPLHIQRMYDVLAQAPADVGWAFPDIVKFGIFSTSYPSGPYNPLEHLLHNICEAGSMVRTEVFTAGLRFDESMRSGFEDWDFWLQCLSSGFYGRHVPNSGFRYRERPESMLSDANRKGEQLKAELRQKHKSLYNTDVLKPCCESYIACVDDDFGVSITEDFRSYTSMDFDAFTDLMVRQYADAKVTTVPRYVLYAPRSLREILDRLRLTSGIVWNLMRHMKEKAAAGASISFQFGEPVAVSSFEETPERENYDLLLVSARSLFAGGPENVVRDESGRSKVEGAFRYEIIASESWAPDLLARRRADETYDIVRGKIQSANLATTEHGYIQRCRLLYWEKDRIAHDLLGVRTVLPADYAVKGKVALILPQHSVELDRIAATYAKKLGEDGHQVYVVVVGENGGRWESHDLFPTASDFIFFAPCKPKTAEKSYLGESVAGLTEADLRSALGLLVGMSAIVNFGVPALNPVMSGLKRHGIRTICFRPEPPAGLLSSRTLAANLISGFENVYDRIVVDSTYFKRVLHEVGVPREKLWHVPSVDEASPSQEVPIAWEPTRDHDTDAVNVLIWDPCLTDETLDFARLLNGGAIGVDARCRLNNGDEVIDPTAISPRFVEHGSTAKMTPRASQLDWADIFVVTEPNGYVPLAALDAVRHGCKCLVVDRGNLLSQDFADDRFIFVEDATSAIQNLVAALRRERRQRERSTAEVFLSPTLQRSTIREAVLEKL